MELRLGSIEDKFSSQGDQECSLAILRLSFTTVENE